MFLGKIAPSRHYMKKDVGYMQAKTCFLKKEVGFKV